MKDDKLPRIGIIEKDGINIALYLDNYCATLMNTSKSEIKFAKENAFIFGKTYDHKEIAIFKGDTELSVKTVRKLNTWAYLVASDNALSFDWTGFDTIEFRGGTLNNLFLCNALNRTEHEDNEIKFKFNDDSIKIPFNIGDCECTITICSYINEGSAGFNGREIKNNTVAMRLSFSKKQPLNTVFEYIQKNKELMSIMTFRKNVGFDEIILYHQDRSISKIKVFIKEDTSFTEKHILHNLTFDDLKENIPNLLSIIYGSKDNSPSYEIGFLPLNDRDVRIMTNDKIRLICSALECELTFLDGLFSEENEKMKKLTKEIKATIKSHRESEDKLLDKTYDLMFSNIKNWSMAASDKIIQLYHKYDEAMLVLNPLDLHIWDDKIVDFVKYRNSITHGTWKVMNDDIAVTAYILQGLVYCSLLKRIGVSDEKITEFCRRNKIIT